MSENSIFSKMDNSSRRQIAGMRESRVDRRDGFALVIVLAVIVLLVVLIVGFVSSAGTERTAASGYHSSVMTRQLADTAVNLIQGQINMATTQGSGVAWASQPGMIRTYSNADGGPLIKAYKLYSASEMISKEVNLTADLPPVSWGSDTAIWTDLNAPVEVKGFKHYPILDPSSLGSAGQAPEGFAITNAPGSTSYQQAPMPVRWLYILENGSVVVPSNTSGKTATVPGADKSSIVGRIAFWTDDDTSKVNINTASDGTYWDTPRVLTAYEYNNLSPSQPAYREFQRYPGHPAMTSLRSVFPFLTAPQIYSIVPRVQRGGSQEGTIRADSVTSLSLDNDRLYSNVEEMIFQPNHAGQNNGLSPEQIERSKFFLSARSRAPETNLFNLPRIACWPIFRMDTTGNPDTVRTTVTDRLIAFCSSTGELGTSSFHPYIFQRENPLSSSNDIGISRNVDLYNYLRYLTSRPVPGFGGNFSNKYGADRDQILTEIFDYIRCINLRDSSLANWNPANTKNSTAYATAGFVVPTVYNSEGTKTMGFGRYYTLSELGIAFICNATGDPAFAALGSNNLTINKVLSGNLKKLPSGEMGPPEPLEPDESLIQAIIVPEFFSPMQGFVGMSTSYVSGGIRNFTETPFCVQISGLESLKIDNGFSPPDNVESLFPTIGNAVAKYGTTQSMNNVLPIGGSPNYRFFAMNLSVPSRGVLPADPEGALKPGPFPFEKGYYPFVGNIVKVKRGPTNTMSFLGGTLTVKIYVGETATGDPIQTLDIRLPAAALPIPLIAEKGTAGPTSVDAIRNAQNQKTDPENWWAFNVGGTVKDRPGRFNFVHWQDFGAGRLFRTEYDTIRTVYPSHGDYRLIAANPSVGSNVFNGQPRLINRTAASLAGDRGVATGGIVSGETEGLPDNDRTGKLVDASYQGSVIPDFPSGFQSNKTHGDFDNGIAALGDGPYVNMADAGDLDTGGSPYFGSTFNWSTSQSLGSTLFSPNRQMPSAGMFGSLSTGVLRERPWETLLFRPAKNIAEHPNYSTTIPDHLMMDLFWMPVVEPYALSDRFSTAGKINMNCQILPFTYIKRETGLYATLKAEKMAVIPVNRAGDYKGGPYSPVANFNSRLDIDVAETLKQFSAKFSAGDIFKSASEICDMHMVPMGSTLTQLQGSFWQTNALTGDNLREKIYATLYPRLTTKSNTYTVHFQVQALKKVSESSGIKTDTWTEGRDVVLGEYRGSTSIERFIDANNKDIPNYAANPANIGNSTTPTLDSFYRWRVIENRQFAP